MVDYNGASLVPDLSNALRLALGIAQQHEQKQQQLQAAGLSDQLAGASAGGMNILTNPDNIKKLIQLHTINPEGAKFAIGLAQIHDQNVLAAVGKQSEDASRVYQALVDIRDPAERNRFLARTIREKETEGQDTSKLREMIGLSPDEQSVRARGMLIMTGHFKDFIEQQNEAVLKNLQIQGEQLKQVQTAQEMDLARRKDARDTTEEGAKVQDRTQQQVAAQKSVEDANQQARDEASMVNNQIDQVLQTLPKSWSGAPGWVGKTVNPSGAFGGTSAAKYRQLDTLKSMIAINRLMDMKRNSPTGASGFGSLSEKELSAIQNSLSNLDPSQSDADLARSLESIRNVFSGISQRAGGAHLTSKASGAQAAPQRIGNYVVREQTGAR